MTPNPFTALKFACSPHKWLRRSSSTPSLGIREHWDDPIPGTYEYKPGRGWYLVEIDNVDVTSPDDASRPRLPCSVTYCKLLHRYMLAPEFNERRFFDHVKNEKGDSRGLGFFRLDDGVTFVQCWSSDGSFIPGPYKRWCRDDSTKHMRPMQYKDTVIDGEARESRRSSWEKSQLRQFSVTSSRAVSPEPSRESRRASLDKSRLRQQSVINGVYTSPGLRNLRSPDFITRKSSASTAAGSTQQSTSISALTTPGGETSSRIHPEVISSKELRKRLMLLKNYDD